MKKKHVQTKTKQRKPNKVKKTKNTVQRPDFQDNIAKPTPLSFEEALVRGVLKETEKTSYNSILFHSSFAYISKSLLERHYMNGLHVGKIAHRLVSSKPHLFHEESLADLVIFLERAGYNYITLHSDINGMKIKIYNKERVYLGGNMHIFEAGIISGFMSASINNTTRFKEISCVNNGDECCTFAQHNAYEFEALGNLPLTKLIEHISLISSQEDKTERISTSYSSLSCLSLMEKEYFSEVKEILYHLGTISANNIFPNPRRPTKIYAPQFERVLESIGMGMARVKSFKPLNITVKLSYSLSRKESVEMLIAFVEGLIRPEKEYKVILSKEIKGHYKITIAQK